MKQEELEIMRHSFAHVLMQALEKMYGAIPAVGPAIENGFYHDFDCNYQVKEEDLPKIEKTMKKIIKDNLKIEKEVMSIDDAIKILQEKKYIYTVELAEDLKNAGETEVSFYKQGDFMNMCKGPHCETTRDLNHEAFKLTKIAGAYWKGDEKNKMIQRIYGVAFNTAEELAHYVEMQKEAERREHKRLGRELDLFSFHDTAPGMVHWHEKGMILWNELESFGKKIRKKHGSIEIKTPQMAKNTLWITSGHWDHYHEDMFVFDVDKETYCLKPMDCPFNINIYQTKMRSYKELPIRYTEIGRVFRNEKSGQLNGLFRVREISQDDSHIFCREEQVEGEIINLLNMVDEFYQALDITPEFFLSTRPEDFMGEISAWDKAEADLKKAMNDKGIKYGLKDKDGAFYGPKIDVNIKDVFGRSWQVATIQLDFQLPGRFNCEYIAEDGKAHTPVMIHAAIFGSFERMIGILIEHFGGAFPVWLSPVQVKLVAVSEKHAEFCEKLADDLRLENIRVEVEASNETVGNKIRKAVAEKVPYMLVIGDKEVNNENLNIRDRGSDQVREISKVDFVAEIKKKIVDKK